MTGFDETIETIRATGGLPEADGDLTFDAPWQARAFALVVTLHREGHFEWNEFQARLIDRIESADLTVVDDPEADYYRQWLAAAETLLHEKGLLSEAAFTERVAAFAAGERDASEFVAGVEHAHGHGHGHGHGHTHEGEHGHDR